MGYAKAMPSRGHFRREVLPSCIVVYYAQLVVKFNFGPNFNFFPQDFGRLPIPQPMRSEVPLQAIEVKIDVPAENDIARRFEYNVVLAYAGSEICYIKQNGVC